MIWRSYVSISTLVVEVRRQLAAAPWAERVDRDHQPQVPRGAVNHLIPERPVELTLARLDVRPRNVPAHPRDAQAFHRVELLLEREVVLQVHAEQLVTERCVNAEEYTCRREHESFHAELDHRS